MSKEKSEFTIRWLFRFFIFDYFGRQAADELGFICFDFLLRQSSLYVCSQLHKRVAKTFELENRIVKECKKSERRREGDSIVRSKDAARLCQNR